MLLRMALRKKMARLTAVTTAVALAIAPVPALAQQQKGPPVIRDTESEQLLREYTRPILRAAGLERQNIQIVIINESVFNAFVADGRRIFVNYGAMMQSETPNQIIGVLAHETGHLAGGHLAKMREQMAQAQTQMIIAMLLGAGAMIAGSRGNNSNGGLANAGAAAGAGPQEMIRRTLISYVRQQEENADRAGVNVLTASGQSAQGMYETVKRVTDHSQFRAEALVEGGTAAEAIAPLRRAVQLSNSVPLIEMLLGQALVGTDNKAYTEEAISILRAAVARETEAPLGYTQLAMAYGRKGDFAQADLASAQAAFLRGDNKTARELASRSKTPFAVGTPGWAKADDTVPAKPMPGPTSN